MKVLKQYADFEGRARRKEYWMFALISFIISFVLLLIDFMITFILGFGFLTILYGLAILVPSLAVSVRRMHDLNKSAWVLLLGLIPFVGALVIFIFSLMEGTYGPNDYGPDPKAEEHSY